VKPLTDFQRAVLKCLPSVRLHMRTVGQITLLMQPVPPAYRVRHTLGILKARGLVVRYGGDRFSPFTWWSLAELPPITAAECVADPGLGRLGG